MTLTHLQKLPKNMRDLGKLIVAKGFKKLPKVQKNRPIWSHWCRAAFKASKHDPTKYKAVLSIIH